MGQLKLVGNVQNLFENYETQISFIYVETTQVIRFYFVYYLIRIGCVKHYQFLYEIRIVDAMDKI